MPTRKQLEKRWQELPDILKDAMHSAMTLNEIENIEKNFHLSEERGDQLARLVRWVFYGFIHPENLFNEIKEALKIDSRIALDIYHQLDKNVFSLYKKEIEDNYIKHKIGAAKEAEIVSTQPLSAQVVLKEPGAVNLKNQIETNLQTVSYQQPPVKIKIEEDKSLQSGPVLIDQISAKPESQDKSLENSAESEKSADLSSKSQEILDSNKISQQPSSLQSDGPLIIHQKEEVPSVAGVKAAATPFRLTSFGGYRGSFKSLDLGRSLQQEPHEPLSVKVEIPLSEKGSGESNKVEASKASLNLGEQQVPISVKKYDQPANSNEAKTVHYSNFKTPLQNLKSSADSLGLSSSKNNPQENNSQEEVVDLTKLTFGK
jgi:hypothetical protein